MISRRRMHAFYGQPDIRLTLNGARATLLTTLLVVCAMPSTLAKPMRDLPNDDLTSVGRASVLSLTQALLISGRQHVDAFLTCANDPWVVESARRNLDPMLLYSMALTESRTRWSDGWVRPCPYCLRLDGVAYRPDNRRDAEALIRSGVARGARITDVGPLQINAHVHSGRVGGDATRFLDMRTNIRIGADILAEAIESTNDFETGLGRYHSWNAVFGRPYGVNARKRYRHLVEQVAGGTLWPQCHSLLPK